MDQVLVWYGAGLATVNTAWMVAASTSKSRRKVKARIHWSMGSQGVNLIVVVNNHRHTDEVVELIGLRLAYMEGSGHPTQNVLSEPLRTPLPAYDKVRWTHVIKGRSQFSVDDPSMPNHITGIVKLASGRKVDVKPEGFSRENMEIAEGLMASDLSPSVPSVHFPAPRSM